MSPQTNCPHCHQPMPVKRLGVGMSALKARIFDAIVRAGALGIVGRDVVAALELDMSPRTLKVHVSQINSAIEDTKHRIIGGRVGYRLLKRHCTRRQNEPVCGAPDRRGWSCCGGWRPVDARSLTKHVVDSP